MQARLLERERDLQMVAGIRLVKRRGLETGLALRRRVVRASPPLAIALT